MSAHTYTAADHFDFLQKPVGQVGQVGQQALARVCGVLRRWDAGGTGGTKHPLDRTPPATAMDGFVPPVPPCPTSPKTSQTRMDIGCPTCPTMSHQIYREVWQ